MRCPARSCQSTQAECPACELEVAHGGAISCESCSTDLECKGCGRAVYGRVEGMEFSASDVILGPKPTVALGVFSWDGVPFPYKP